MAAKVNELLQKTIDARRRAADAKAALSAMLADHGAKAEAEKRYFSREEKAAQAKLEADIKAAETDELRHEEAHAVERKRIDEMLSRVAAGHRNYPGLDPNWEPPNDDDDPAAVSALPVLPSRTQASIARMYSEATYVRGESREHFRQVVAAAFGGPLLHPAMLAAAQTEGVDSEGGFALTPDVARGIFTRSFEESFWLRVGVRLERMTTAERDIVAFDDADESSDAEAGITARQLAEAAADTVQKAKIRRVHLHAEKLGVLAAVSSELAEDAPDFIPSLEGALTRAISKKFDRMVLTGAGVTVGILNGPATVTITKETGQAAATILWGNITKAWSRLAPGSHESAVWVASPTCLPQLLTLSFPIGVAGAQPRQALESGGPTGYTLMSRPVYVTSRVPALGTKGDLILVDPSQFVVGLRRGITVQRSDHALFSSDSIAIRATMRACGGQLWNAVKTPVTGDTVSPYVVIETRA